MKQPSPSELFDAVRECTDILESLDIAYHLTGGLVSTYYGDPRFTQDIDIVLRLQPDQSAQLTAALQQAFNVQTQALAEAVATQSMFQALTPKTFIKIDFHVGEEVPDELERSIRTEMVPGLTVNIPSIEDAIASKLYWIKLGSHKSRADVVGMMNSEHDINYEQLSNTCAQMDLGNLLDELIAEAENE